MLSRRTMLAMTTAMAATSTRAADPPYRVRMIAGELDGKVWTAGVDVTLDESWKTYWRMPGEAGIPPLFDWTGSRDVAAVEVLWPVPARYSDLSGETIGYARRVVFPLRVITEGSAPQLKLAMFFGVCKDICIPARFSGMLDRVSPAPRDLSLLQSYLARVPYQHDFIGSARIIDGALALELLEDAPADPDLFVESDTLAYFRAPRRAESKRYILPIDGLKDPLALVGKRLRVTLVAGDHRLEQSVAVA